MTHAFEWIRFPLFSDERGTTLPIEFETLPFVVQRAYFVTGNKNHVRGGHAHITEEEIFWVVSGSVEAVLHDGKSEHHILLDDPTKALYIRSGCWHAFKNFQPDTMLGAFSSIPYRGREGYIMDKESFLQRYGS